MRPCTAVRLSCRTSRSDWSNLRLEFRWVSSVLVLFTTKNPSSRVRAGEKTGALGDMVNGIIYGENAQWWNMVVKGQCGTPCSRWCVPSSTTSDLRVGADGCRDGGIAHSPPLPLAPTPFSLSFGSFLDKPPLLLYLYLSQSYSKFCILLQVHYFTILQLCLPSPRLSVFISLSSMYVSLFLTDTPIAGQTHLISLSLSHQHSYR